MLVGYLQVQSGWIKIAIRMSKTHILQRWFKRYSRMNKSEITEVTWWILCSSFCCWDLEFRSLKTYLHTHCNFFNVQEDIAELIFVTDFVHQLEEGRKVCEIRIQLWQSKRKTPKLKQQEITYRVSKEKKKLIKNNEINQLLVTYNQLH